MREISVCTFYWRKVGWHWLMMEVTMVCRWLLHWHACGIPSILSVFTAKNRWAHATSLSEIVCLTVSETTIFCFLRDVPSAPVQSSTYVTSFTALRALVFLKFDFEAFHLMQACSHTSCETTYLLYVMYFLLHDSLDVAHTTYIRTNKFPMCPACQFSSECGVLQWHQKQLRVARFKQFSFKPVLAVSTTPDWSLVGGCCQDSSF